jgi:hypothetical protein
MPDDLDMQYSPDTLAELGKLSIKMSRNPKLRPTLLKMVKAQDPSYQLPADLQVQDVRAEIAAQKAREQIEAKAREVQSHLEAQRAALLKGELMPGRTFDDDQVKEIETVMQKYGLSDYEAGAKIFVSDMKPPKPQGRGSAGATWSFPDLPGLMDDPAGAARNAAYSVIDELQGRR